MLRKILISFFFVSSFILNLKTASVIGAAIIPMTKSTDPVALFEEQFLADPTTRRAPISGLDLETLTKNAAIRTNQENAILQQLAFRRNQLMTTRDTEKMNNTLAAEVANNDLMNAMILPSAAGHSTNSLGFQLGLPTLEKDRILIELVEQNRRQQLEIQRLVQQNMIRHGRPIMPFEDERFGFQENRFGNEQLGFPENRFANEQFGFNPEIGRIVTATSQPILGRETDALAIMNQIRSVTSRNANSLAQNMASQRTQNNIDLEFLRRQTNPFEAPQRSPFFEEVTDAFGRRLPLQLKDPLALDSALPEASSIVPPTTRGSRNLFRINGSPIATNAPSPQKTGTTTTTPSTPTTPSIRGIPSTPAAPSTPSPKKTPATLKTTGQVVALNKDSKIDQVESEE